MNKGQFAGLLFTTFTKWQKHDATLRAAALTFFTIMPLPSLALIAVEILSLFYGQQQALQRLISQISAVAGPAVANLISELLSNARSPLTSFFESFIAVSFAVLGAIGALSVLQKSMDIIWELKQPKERGKAGFIKEKVLPFGLIVIIGVIVVASNAVSTVFFGTIVFMLQPVIGPFAPFLFKLLQIILSLSLGTILFAIIFKMLPETTVQWRDVWLASLLTAIVFTILNYFFGLYLSLVKISTLEGTAGSLIVLLLWLYLTNLFILFGAQFSKVYAQTHGSQKNTKPMLKWPPRPTVDKIEVIAEVQVKVKEEKT
jgi:membrane protein